MNIERNSVVVAEDSPRDREYLLGALGEYDLEMARDGQEAIDLLRSSSISLVISDVQMPRINGIELARQVWSFRPAARIVFWSNYRDEIYLRSLSRIIPPDTVYGYILKDCTSEIFDKAVRQVFQENQCWIDPKVRTVQARGYRGVDDITDAEYEMLIDIALGLTDNIIAKRHYLSRRGVQSRLKSLYQKLHIEHRLAPDSSSEVMNPRSRAVAIAFQRGLINNKELSDEEAKLEDWFRREIDVIPANFKK